MVGIINKFGEKKKISIKEVKGETKARVSRKWIFLMISKPEISADISAVCAPLVA